MDDIGLVFPYGTKPRDDPGYHVDCHGKNRDRVQLVQLGVPAGIPESPDDDAAVELVKRACAQYPWGEDHDIKSLFYEFKTEIPDEYAPLGTRVVGIGRGDQEHLHECSLYHFGLCAQDMALSDELQGKSESLYHIRDGNLVMQYYKHTNYIDKGLKAMR